MKLYIASSAGNRIASTPFGSLFYLGTIHPAIADLIAGYLIFKELHSILTAVRPVKKREALEVFSQYPTKRLLSNFSTFKFLEKQPFSAFFLKHSVSIPQRICDKQE
jgi:hypothetical protein